MEENKTMTTEMNENLITSFLEITSSSREEAAFFLESHHWNLDDAVSTFLDNDATTAATANDLPAGPNPSLPPPSIPAASPHSPSESSLSRSRSPSPSSRDAPYRLRPKAAASENQGAGNPSGRRNTVSRQHAGNIHALADLNLSPADGADSDSDEGQEYYTGGQRSGMMVQDPKKPKDVDALFEQASLSAVDKPVEPSRSASTSFIGASGKLSGEPVPSSPQQPHQQQQGKPQLVMRTITFWRNGFTVDDDGPLRSFEDPENVAFMESIARSECPRELESVDTKIRVCVCVKLVRREDHYIEPPKPKNSPQGVERTLGASGSGSASAELQAPPAQLNTAPVPSVGLVVDKPVEPSRSASTSFNGASGMLSGEPVPSAPQHPQRQKQATPQLVRHTITLWRNGFTVDDGPLRRLEDPENVAFMESVVRLECPRELYPVDRTIRVPVLFNLVRREDNNYIEPPKPKNSPQGVERTLGASGSGSASAEPQAPPATLNTAPVPSSRLVVGKPVEPLRSASTSFTGASRMLSGEPVPSTPQQPQQQQQDNPQLVMHTITFWRNGFTVDDGPLRRLEDPENVAFMESVVRLECPRELEPVDIKTPLCVRFELFSNQANYIEPPKPKNSPQGVERTLGASGSGSAAAEPQAPPAPLNTAPVPSVGLVVDQAAPTALILLRLADGTRLISRFNNHHTVREVRGFIDASRPDDSRGYQLLTMGFPPKQLTDLDQTIEQADIANWVVIQKF